MAAGEPSVARRPAVDTAQAEALARAWYGVDGAAHELPSERDRNFRIEPAGDAGPFVLKISNAQERAEWLECQSEVLEKLAADLAAEGSPFPRVIDNRDGDRLTRVDQAGETLLVRMLTHVPGVPLAGYRPQSPALLRDLGGLLGRVDVALQAHDHPELHRDLSWDLVNAAGCFARHDDVIVDPERRALAAYFSSLYEREAAPRLEELPRSAIHGDANDYNVMVDVVGPLAEPRLGLIDFGDMVHSCTVGELAVATAYAMLDKPDPLAAAADVVAGYHAARELTQAEVDVLFPLICTRLCMSATFAATQRREAPDNEYLSVSEEPVWRALHQLAEVPPSYARYVLRHACGWSPCPESAAVREWISEHGSDAAPVIPAELLAAPVEFDLSVGSPDAAGPELGVDELTARSTAAVRAAGGRVGVGRYDEARLLYVDDRFRTHQGDPRARRTVHLGVDLFALAGTPVSAPLEGVVHGLADNSGEQDYGPTIVLEHRVDGGPTFHTLFGHLSRESLEGLVVGQRIERGQLLARVGAPPENGNWPPHLHFQVITDMLGRVAEFPGVADPDQRAVWLDLCPDPSALLGLPATARASSSAASDLLARRGERLGPSLSLSYRRPLHIVRGIGAQLFDVEGRAYLDCSNNVCHVGHAHPEVVEAAARQAAVLNTNTRYLHDNILDYADRLAGLFPDPLSVCFFVCSGSEANELALRMARAHTAARDVVVLEGGYHGNTSALVDVSHYKYAGPGGAGAPDWVTAVAMPDTYRGAHRGPDAAARYAAEAADALAGLRQRGRDVAAFLGEPLMGCGGQVVLPEGYLAEVYRDVRAAGGLCIADEVQIGFGRVGSHMWGFEACGVVPDIVTLGKPIGNGHPLGAVVTTPEIARSFANGMEYFNTFGGNPVSCAVGAAVLDVIEREGLQENARVAGQRLLEGLEELRRDAPLIGDVRGLGLFVGVELVLDAESRAPAPEHASYVAERLRDLGVLVGVDGPSHNVIKLKPPLVFSVVDAERVIDSLRRVLAENPVQL